MKTLRTVLGISMLGLCVICLVGGVYCLTRSNGQPEDKKLKGEVTP